MNGQQLEQMKNGRGFIAALDQSGGSSPRALETYGIGSDQYHNDEEMLNLVHQMRTRIITSSAFTSDKIVGAILFKVTMESQIDGVDTADYLWNHKQIVPFVKVDEGLADEVDGAQMLRPMPELGSLLTRAKEKNVFGTKMRSLIHSNNETGIRAVVDQQFQVAQQIIDAGLVPIIEPEVSIEADEKAQIEDTMLSLLQERLQALNPEARVILKLTLPEQDNLYAPLMDDEHVVRVIALSGGYSIDEANARLARNNGLIASFSRALASNLRAQQSDEEFDSALGAAVDSIYEASLT